MKKWTIGIVNFRSAIYMKWQLKILYEFNCYKDFNLIIVDNTNDDCEYDLLSKMCAPYIKSYRNLEIIKNNKDVNELKEIYGDRFFVSGHHGQGVNMIFDIAKETSKYLLIQDPDFFYVKKNYLRIFEQLHEKGNVSIGAPYPEGVAWGDPFYPEAYGCSYVISYLDNISFTPGLATDGEMEIFNKKYNKKYLWWGFDVGWRIRKDHSDKPFISFDQRICDELIKKLGQQFRSKPFEYKLKGSIIGYHLNGGTRHPKEKKEYVEKYSPEQLNQIYDEWQATREKYSRYFYDMISGNLGFYFSVKNNFSKARYFVGLFFTKLK